MLNAVQISKLFMFSCSLHQASPESDSPTQGCPQYQHHLPHHPTSRIHSVLPPTLLPTQYHSEIKFASHGIIE